MCGETNWKREVCVDHKFDFIDVKEFHSTGCSTRFQYVWLYALVIKSGAVYIADIYTAIALLASNHWSGEILQAATKSGHTTSTLTVPFDIGKWIFTGCIIFSFLLLLWEARKSRAIVRSRDISFAYTNVMSQNWYSLRDYNIFCFFCQINNSKKKKDELAFFVFFTFKGWLRLLLADGPRAAINGITLYSFGSAENWTTDLSVYFGGSFLKTGIIITMLFTLVVWVGSFILLLIATIMYIPLLCYIQGNLKEYCCHKVDKRIGELMKRKTRKRLAKEAEIARKEAKTGKFSNPQPTLPQTGLKDDDLFAPSYAGSEVGGSRSTLGGTGGNGSRKGNGSQYQYPPSSNGFDWDTKSAGNYGNGNGNAGIGTINGTSNLSRTTYPYTSSDVSLNNPSYAESINSLDGLATRGVGMGYDSNPSNYNNNNGRRISSLGLGNGGGGGNAGRSRMSESQAPSYHSNEEEKLNYNNTTTTLNGDEYSRQQEDSYLNGYNNHSFTSQQRTHDPYAQTQYDNYPSSQSQQQQQHYNQDQHYDASQQYDQDQHQHQHQQYDHYDHQQQQSTGMNRNESQTSNSGLGGYAPQHQPQFAQEINYGGWEESNGRTFEGDQYQSQSQQPYDPYSQNGGNEGGGGGGGSRRR